MMELMSFFFYGFDVLMKRPSVKYVYAGAIRKRIVGGDKPVPGYNRSGF
jgi:hypothetical protein